MAQLLEVLRTEQKYDLSLEEMFLITSRLNGILQGDKHNHHGGYMVRSLYFDTVNDDDFYDKLDGLEIRRKIRLRVYSPDAKTAKLELKEKTGNNQRKRSLTLSREEAAGIVDGDYKLLYGMDNEFANELYCRMTQYCYRPKCIVQYYRTAFAEAVNDTRVTFDRDLRATEINMDIFDPELMLYPVGLQTGCTMELKFNNFLLSYVKNAVSIADRSNLSASKYGMARNYLIKAAL
ncbi:MAG: polyphosphate polymerase domain-containing protein [Lachnospiraceae bacterium]|nr:polyphosphate polymerase domain-containing protein [Lachnospiraceae bacterium]